MDGCDLQVVCSVASLRNHIALLLARKRNCEQLLQSQSGLFYYVERLLCFKLAYCALSSLNALIYSSGGAGSFRYFCCLCLKCISRVYPPSTRRRQTKCIPNILLDTPIETGRQLCIIYPIMVDSFSVRCNSPSIRVLGGHKNMNHIFPKLCHNACFLETSKYLELVPLDACSVSTKPRVLTLGSYIDSRP